MCTTLFVLLPIPWVEVMTVFTVLDPLCCHKLLCTRRILLISGVVHLSLEAQWHTHKNELTGALAPHNQSLIVRCVGEVIVYTTHSLVVERFHSGVVACNNSVRREFAASCLTPFFEGMRFSCHFTRFSLDIFVYRGAKLLRRYGLSEAISLLSLAYLWSVKQEPFHSEPLGHYDILS